MSITRTADTDANAAGTSGTVRDNAWKTTLYDQLDARWIEKTITSTGTQNNVSLVTSGTLEADVLLCFNASDLVITGLVAPSAPAKPGKTLDIYANGAGNVYLAYNSASSSSGNKVIHPVTSGPGIPLGAGYGRARLKYNGSTTPNRWEVISHEQGTWINQAFSAGDYTAATGNWTVGSGDVNACRFFVRGSTMELVLDLATTDVSATTASLRRAIPAGYSLNIGLTNTQPVLCKDNGAAWVWGRMDCVTGSALYFYATANGGGWATASGTTELRAHVHLELL